MKRIRDGGRKAPTTPPAARCGQCGEPLGYVTPNGLCADCAYECVLALEDN